MNYRLFGLLAVLATAFVSNETYSNEFYHRDYQTPGLGYDGCDQYNDCCAKNFSVEADFLYWELRQTESLGTKFKSTSNGVSTFSKTTSLHPHTKYDPGVRIGFHYQDNCLCWNWGVIWTHLNTHTHSHFNADAGGDILTSNVQHAVNKFHSRLDYVDLDVSKRICLLPCFSLTPHIGLRGLWVDTHSRTLGEGAIPASTVNARLHQSFKFNDKGYGVEGGLWLRWNLDCGLALVGHVGGSVLYYTGKFTSKSSELDTDVTGAVTSDLRSEFKNHLKSGTPTFNYFLGVEYNFCLCGYDLVLNLGWEHMFLDFEFYEYHGLTTGLAVSF